MHGLVHYIISILFKLSSNERRCKGIGEAQNNSGGASTKGEDYSALEFNAVTTLIFTNTLRFDLCIGEPKIVERAISS